MRAGDKVVKDKKIVEKILRTLTPQYDHIVVAIAECKDMNNIWSKEGMRKKKWVRAQIKLYMPEAISNQEDEGLEEVEADQGEVEPEEEMWMFLIKLS